MTVRGVDSISDKQSPNKALQRAGYRPPLSFVVMQNKEASCQ
jgi:hypothetical protein